MFHGYSQQDAMDFLRCIFERMHDELKVTVPPHIVGVPSDNTGSPSKRKSFRLSQKAAVGNSDPTGGSKMESIISQIFGGVLSSQVECLTCGSVSLKEDPFFDLSVQIVSEPTSPGSPPGNRSLVGSIFSSISETFGFAAKPVQLETCLEAFCSPEILDGQDSYWCERCQKLVASRKTLSILKTPEVLCIQLKRFKHEGYFSSKINTPVLVPMETMSISTMLASRTGAVAPDYRLCALVNHRGSFNGKQDAPSRVGLMLACIGGHYVSYCRRPQTGQWFEYDDTLVTLVDAEVVRAAQAYLLFFERCDAAANQERDEWTLRTFDMVSHWQHAFY